MTARSEIRQNPYIGPRAFERKEREKFFGRQREIRELARLLIAQRIVLCHSPSGAGKTSLIQAGLIEELERNDFHVLPVIRVSQELSPDFSLPETTNRYILSTLLSLEQAKPPAQQLPLAELAELTLDGYLRKRFASGTAIDIVLIFDQFEEILTSDPLNFRSKHAFFQQIGTALRNDYNWALFAIREDYVASLEPFLDPLPGRLATTYQLPLLDQDRAIQAMQEPVRGAGAIFTDAAAHRLADDLRRTRVQRSDGLSELQLGPYIEPVQLQVVCYRLWERLSSAEGGHSQAIAVPDSPSIAPVNQLVITESDIATVGDVNRALAEYYAERVARVAQLVAVSERTIRDWFDQQLVTVAGIRSQVLQGPVESGGLDNRVIRALVDAHLVRAERQRGATWFELAHDRLIEPIRTNNAAWLQANLSQLQRQAALWQHENEPAGLLFRDSALAEAEAWAGTHAADLMPIDRKFLEESRSAQAAAERERRQNRIIGWVAIVAVITGMIAIALAIVAFRANFDATNARAMAETEAANAEAARASAESAGAIAQAEANNAEYARATAEVERFRAEQNALEVARRILNADGLAALNAGDIDQALALALASVRASPDSPQAQFLLAQAISLSGTKQRFTGHTGAIFSVALTRDGKTAISGSQDQTIRLWDTNTGSEIRQLTGHRSAILKVVLSPDEQTLLSCSEDGTLRLWDIAGGQEIRRFTGHTAAIVDVGFSPDGRTILSASNDGTVRLWDIDSGQEIRQLRGAAVASFSPDGTSILISMDDNSLQLWDIAAGKEIWRFTGHTAAVRSLAFSPDGLTAVSAGQDTTIRLWDLVTGQELPRFDGHSATVWSVVFSPDGQSILSGSADNTIRLWDVNSGQELRRFAGHTGSVFSVAFSSDARMFLSGAEDQTLRLWDLENRQELRRFTGHTAAIYSIAMTNDGKELLSGSEDTTLRLWDIANGTELRRFEGHSAPVLSVALSQDGRTALSGSADRTVRLWDVSTGQEIGRFRGHSAKVQVVAFHPDGHTVLSGAENGTLRLWNIATGEELRHFPGHTAGILSAIFSRDGRMIVSCSEDNTIRLWNTDSGQELQSFTGHSAVVVSIAFSPDEKTLISGSADRTLRLWDITSGKELRRFSGHTSGIWAVAFSSDGKTVLSGAADNTVRLWDVASGQELRRFQGHTARVWSILYVPNQPAVLSSSSDRTIRLWRLDSVVQLVDWVQRNRYIPTLTCAQRTLYQLEPACDMPEATPRTQP